MSDLKKVVSETDGTVDGEGARGLNLRRKTTGPPPCTRDGRQRDENLNVKDEELQSYGKKIRASTS